MNPTEHTIQNIWTSLPTTLTGLGVIAAALVPVFSVGMPTNAGGWAMLAMSAVAAVERALASH